MNLSAYSMACFALQSADYVLCTSLCSVTDDKGTQGVGLRIVQVLAPHTAVLVHIAS